MVLTTELIFAGVISGVLIGGTIVHILLFTILLHLARKTDWLVDNRLVQYARWPSLPIFIGILLLFLAPLSPDLDDVVIDRMRLGLGIILIICSGWFLVRMMNVIEFEVYRTHKVDMADNLDNRRIRTQVAVLKRILQGIIILATIGATIASFEKTRQFGTAVLASAGVIGLVVGLSATPTIENAIAAIQIALTQPIRLDDVVIVDGEWGKIEEIGATYVVVAIWDQRRLIVPLTRFTRESFQNWTRKTSEILGTVFLHVDYTMPVKQIRTKLEEIVKESKYWDKRVCVVQVTDCRETTMEVRCLISAKNAGDAFDLRCLVREKMIEFIQTNYPNSLPKFRISDNTSKQTKEKKKKEPLGVDSPQLELPPM